MRALIYYPYINPPSQWIKQSLLYWDRICTIIHADWKNVVHPDLYWLLEHEAYEPLSPADIPDHEVERLRSELIEYLALRRKSPLNSDVWGGKSESVYYEKIPKPIEDELRKAGYLKDSGDRLEVDSGIFGVLLCLIAKYLSRHLSWEGERQGEFYSVYTMGVDFESCNFEPIRRDRSEKCIQLVLNNFLPVPSETVPLDDILGFKRDHEGELMAFRRALDSLYARLAEEGPEERVFAAALDEVGAALAMIKDSFKRAKIHTLLLSFSVLLTVGTTIARTLVLGQPIMPAPPEILEGMSMVTATGRLVRERNLQGPFSYLHRAIREFG